MTARASMASLWAEAGTISAAELAAAAGWWVDARAEVDALARRAGVPFERMAAAVASSSPGVPWRSCLQNVAILVDAALAGGSMPAGPGCGLEIPVGRRHLEKAWRIIAEGADPAGNCRGPKVEAFAANLVGDMDRVTVDRHAVRAATGTDAAQVSRPETARIATMMWACAVALGTRPALVATVLWQRRARTRALARGMMTAERRTA